MCIYCVLLVFMYKTTVHIRINITMSVAKCNTCNKMYKEDYEHWVADMPSANNPEVLFYSPTPVPPTWDSIHAILISPHTTYHVLFLDTEMACCVSFSVKGLLITIKLVACWARNLYILTRCAPTNILSLLPEGPTYCMPPGAAIWPSWPTGDAIWPWSP